MKKLFLIVLYKQKISESKTCISLKENNIQNFNENKIVVWDNSPEVINSQKIANEFFNSETIEFKHTPENLSLSKIYNAVIDNNQDFDFIQILDQDSKIIKENYNSYLNQVFNENSNTNIFLPKIYSNQKLYSPGKFFIKGWHFKEINFGINKSRLYTAITSGLCIRMDFLRKTKIRFNEDLSLYCIDTDFIYRVRKFDSRFYILDLNFIHDLSEDSLTEEEQKQRRKVQIEGLKILYKKNKFFYFLICCESVLLKLFVKDVGKKDA